MKKHTTADESAKANCEKSLRKLQKLAVDGDGEARRRLALFWRMVQVHAAIERNLPPGDAILIYFKDFLGEVGDFVPSMAALEILNEWFFVALPADLRAMALCGWAPDPAVFPREEWLAVNGNDPARFLRVAVPENGAVESNFEWTITGEIRVNLLIPEGTPHKSAVEQVDQIATAVRYDYPAMIRGQKVVDGRRASHRCETNRSLLDEWNAVLDDPKVMGVVEKLRASVPAFIPFSVLMAAVLRRWDFCDGESKVGQLAEMILSNEMLDDGKPSLRLNA